MNSTLCYFFFIENSEWELEGDQVSSPGQSLLLYFASSERFHSCISFSVTRLAFPPVWSLEWKYSCIRLDPELNRFHWPLLMGRGKPWTSNESFELFKIFRQVKMVIGRTSSVTCNKDMLYSHLAIRIKICF